MTNLEIEMLLRIVRGAEPPSDLPQQEIMQVFASLEALGLVGEHPDGQVLTPKGRAFLFFVCSTPVPLEAWAVPSGSALNAISKAAMR